MLFSLLTLLACKEPAAVTIDGREVRGRDDTGEDSPKKDDDNDGYSEADGDCDDEQPAINPMATDLVGDGIDQNCDGADGYDDDGDGHADLTSGGDDCDDTDTYTFPGAIEIWYDGIDQGCVGESWGGDSDQDGDGFDWDGINDDVNHYGGDCVDTNAGINPNTGEDNSDGVDNNCEGTTDGFSLSFQWTPSDNDRDVVLTVSVADDEPGTIALLGIDTDYVPSSENWNKVAVGTWTRALLDNEPTNLTDEYTTVTYFYCSKDGIIATGTTCVVWGPRAAELVSLAGGVDITGRDGLVNDNGSWTWDGL